MQLAYSIDPADWAVIKLELLFAIIKSSQYIYVCIYFGKSNIFKYFSSCQTRSYDFWIMNAMCTFEYLFIVDFSFAPVISASIHHYVNYSDIQVLMMATETEILTLTLIHNKFTYLDYVFLLSSYSRILIHIYFHTVISEKQIPNTFLLNI